MDTKRLLSLSEWLWEQGFGSNPFDAEAFQAETDPEFVSCFVQFGYYEEILGNHEAPGPRFIFARRGAGKTALRKQIERQLNEALLAGVGNTIAITYNDFDAVLERAGHDTAKVTPRMHVERIVTLIVSKLFDFAIQPQPPFRFSELKTPYSKQLLGWYIEKFGHLHAWQISRILARLKGFQYFLSPELALEAGKKVLEGVVGLTLPPLAQNLVETLNEKLTWQKPPEVEPEQISIYDLLGGIVDVCKELGLKAVYILVDDVDEPQYYGDRRTFGPAFQLIRPLAAAPKLLSIKGLIFKFFLPLEIKAMAETAFRLDKHKLREVIWSEKDLRMMLNRRLEVFKRQDKEWAKRPPPHLDDMCVPELRSLEDKLVRHAEGSPRDLLRLGNELLAEHCKFPTAEPLLTVQDWGKALAIIEKDRQRHDKPAESNISVLAGEEENP